MKEGSGRNNPFDEIALHIEENNPILNAPIPPGNAVNFQEIYYDGQDIQNRTLFMGENAKNQEPIFKIFSMTKPMTSALVFRLQELGVIDIHDPVMNYLSYEDGKLKGVGEFPDLTDITIENLLCHTSGLQDYVPAFDDMEASQNITRNEFLKYVPKEKYPDNNRHYCNANYVLIGKLLDTLHAKIQEKDPTYEGKCVADLFKKYIFEPCGMQNAFLDSENTARENIAWNKIQGGLITNSNYDQFKRAWSVPTFEAGGVITSLREVTYFWDGLFKSKIINENSLKQMTKETLAGKLDEEGYLFYGAGINIAKTTDGHTLFFHPGAFIGQQGNAGYAVFKETPAKAYADVTCCIADHEKKKILNDEKFNAIKPKIEALYNISRAESLTLAYKDSKVKITHSHEQDKIVDLTPKNPKKLNK